MTEAFILCWNEAETLHMTIKHYQKFCSSIVIYDNHSTDNSREIARAMGCKVKTFGTPGVLSDQDYRDLKNNCWKKTWPGKDHRDWVIVCDADEILDINPLTLTRAKLQGKTIIKTSGWDVFSYLMPEESFMEIKTGILSENYSKSVMFDPAKISEINYRFGGHNASPKGIIQYTDEATTLFHYRNIGGPERLVKRHELYRARLSDHNKQLGLGCHYLYSDEQRIKEWEEHYKNSREYSLVGA
jgi:glycosyltransferase involved in cell wall biosynthesis